MEEIWKDIEGYGGLYQVSNLGRIKSFKQNKLGKILRMQITHDGYYTVGLSKDNYSKQCKVHRLVAKAFIPNTNNLLEINHKDKNKLNNNVDNLEWCTRQYNCRYSYEDIYKTTKKPYTKHKYRKFGGIYVPSEIFNKF